MSDRENGGPHRIRPGKEADMEQLHLAEKVGRAFGRALENMAEEEAREEEKTAGDYLVGVAVEHAEGLYQWEDGRLVWRDPEEENIRVEVSVRDAEDGRFVPGLEITATLIAPDGSEVGSHCQAFMWHPWLYHYGRNWVVPGDGDYTIRVHIEPPRFIRHDRMNGLRFADPVDVEFTEVTLETGRKPG